MNIPQRVPNHSLEGARFERAGRIYIILGKALPGHICAVDEKAQEPASIKLMAFPKAEEIRPLGSVSEFDLKGD